MSPNPYIPPVAPENKSRDTDLISVFVSSAFLPSFIASTISLLAWSLALFVVAMNVIPGAGDNPAGLGFYIVFLFIIALPFGLVSAGVVLPLIVRWSTRHQKLPWLSAIGLLFLAVAVSIAANLILRMNETLWHYTAFAWGLFTLFVPPAFFGTLVGVWTVRRRFNLAK